MDHQKFCPTEPQHTTCMTPYHDRRSSTPTKSCLATQSFTSVQRHPGKTGLVREHSFSRAFGRGCQVTLNSASLHTKCTANDCGTLAVSVKLRDMKDWLSVGREEVNSVFNLQLRGLNEAQKMCLDYCKAETSWSSPECWLPQSLIQIREHLLNLVDLALLPSRCSVGGWDP
jgi:hypothetical protein